MVVFQMDLQLFLEAIITQCSIEQLAEHKLKKMALDLPASSFQGFFYLGAVLIKSGKQIVLAWYVCGACFFGVPNKHPRRTTTGKVIRQASYKIILNIFVIIFKYLQSYLLNLYGGSLNSTDFGANRNHATYWNKAKRLQPQARREALWLMLKRNMLKLTT